MHFCMMFWTMRFTQFTGQINISWRLRTVISDVTKMYCTNMEFCIWQTSFFVLHM